LRPALTSFLFTQQDVGGTTFVGAFELGLAEERLLGRQARYIDDAPHHGDWGHWRRGCTLDEQSTKDRWTQRPFGMQTVCTRHSVFASAACILDAMPKYYCGTLL
jgi:hypothetical protein